MTLIVENKKRRETWVQPINAGVYYDRKLPSHYLTYPGEIDIQEQKNEGIS